ncbi:p53 negative regulator [Parasponia andersonii]|uniref:p53 negative regulator n=1 Tax=Parasponia andersonii TaxID=3476 RepID=A0A2P5DVJ2_PARAD|nr:p53 negative regulator [Parasponia andersonii]
MSKNNNNQAKSFGVPPHFGNSGAVPQSMAVNHQPHLLSQAQPQTQGGSLFPGHFQLSEPQAQALAQTQHVNVQAQAQAQTQTQAKQARIRADLEAQAQALAQMHNAMTSHAGVSSPAVSTPGTGSAKRANQKPPSRPPSSSNANTSSPFKTMELTPAARRKKRKLPDKHIPDRVAALLPESALYTQLLEFEARVDAALARKKMDIQESFKISPRFQKTLRVYVFNTFTNQTQTTPENKNAEPPTWSLKIVGRLLEDGKDPVVAGFTPNSSPKFSSFFKKITIYLDQNLYPDNHVILWENARSPILHEGFEVKRKGDKEFSAMIRLEMNYVPEKFKLSPALSEVLGIEADSRIRIIAAIWHYVKARKLQNPSDPTSFTCDLPLQKVFGEEKMKFTTVSQKLVQHLTPPQPIHLEHKVKLSGNCPAGTTCYDLLVDVPFSLDKEMSSFLASTENSKEIDACDELISVSIKKIHEHQRRRAFFLGFSQSPAEFINTLITSQSKDLKLVAGDAGRNAEKERRSDFYNQTWVEDAVIRYLNRKSAGSDAPGST